MCSEQDCAVSATAEGVTAGVDTSWVRRQSTMLVLLLPQETQAEQCPCPSWQRRGHLLTSNNYGVVLDWRPSPAVAVDDARQRGCRVRPQGLQETLDRKGRFREARAVSAIAALPMSLQTFLGNHFWFFVLSPLLGAGSPNSSAGRQHPLGRRTWS